jgi:hypothetical protein
MGKQNEEVSRRLGFIEIGGGRLGLEIQADFEEAQIISTERNASVVVELKIIVSPTDDHGYGSASYTHKIVAPPKRSKKYMTLLENGVAVQQGDDEADLLQYKLSLEPPAKSDK